MRQFRLAMLGGYYFLVASFPLFVYAQTGRALPSQIVPCDGVHCTVCDLAQLAQNLINTGIFIFVFLAALLFAYAGFKYLTDAAIGGQQEARTIFKNTVGGLVILLSAWLVVDTLMKAVLGGNFGPWNDICRAAGL